jgi:hypothetical protein
MRQETAGNREAAIAIRFSPVLTPTEVERKLRACRPYVIRDRGWSTRVRKFGLDLDLSEVEYADFAALAQIALLVESAARHRCRVRLATPGQGLSIAERNYLMALGGNADRSRLETARFMASAGRRKPVFRFMLNSGFISALRPSHVPDVDELVSLSFENEIDPHKTHSAKTLRCSPFAGEFAAEYVGSAPNLRHIFPLQWLGHPDALGRAAWEAEVCRVLALRAPSLTTSDVDAIVTIVLRELLANIESHAAEAASEVSCPPAPLLGVIALGTRAPHSRAIGDRVLTREYAQWIRRSGVPVVRLVVGDSGRGICDALQPPSATAPDVDLPDLGRKLRRSERTLIWSLSPWSSSGSQPDTEPRRVRGLASVRRVVRESAGAIILRSADAMAGMVYPDGIRTPVSKAGLAHVPGTLVEVILAPRAATPVQRAESYVRRLHCRAADVREPQWRPDRSLDKDYMLRPLQDSLKSASLDNEVTFLCVVSDIPDMDHESAAFLSQLLQIAEEVVDRSLVVMLCLGQSATEIAPRIRSFDDIRLQSGEAVGVPVMLMDLRGKTCWLGVDRRQSAVLAALGRSAAGGATLDSLAGQVATSKAAVTDSLRRMSTWIRSDGKRARLRLSADAVDEALREYVQKLAHARMATPRRSNVDQVYVTPTLELVRPRILEGQALANLGGDRLAGYVLGRHLGRILKLKTHTDVSIARIGDVSAATTESFRAAMDTSGPVISFSGEVGLYDDPEVPFAAPGSSFVLLASSLVTGERMRHAANDLVRAGARPLGAACVLDRRQVGGKLAILGDHVRVISLARSRVKADGDYAAAIPIDPMRIPAGSKGLGRDIEYPISRDTILSWCESTPDAILTGHIARHSGRHFHSFLDPAPLLAKQSARDVIAEVSVRLLADWLTTSGAIDEVTDIAIFHAGGSGSVASDLAEIIATAVRRWSQSVQLTGTFALPQTLIGGRQVVLPPDADFPPGTMMLVVDWGSVTLHTIQGLMTAAGEAGAVSVLALVLTSQLDGPDEITARAVRAVAAKQPRARGPARVAESLEGERSEGLAFGSDHAVPARIYFLSSFPVGYSWAGECLPCRYAREYAEGYGGTSSELLKTHAKSLAERLAPKDLAECRKDGPRDALGMAISAEEAVRLMRLRGRLEDARLSTAARLRLRDDIGNMTAADLDALIRLLTLESRLLKRAPLRHRNLRVALRTRLMSRLEGADSEGMEVDLRRQYILMLRAIAKRDYLTHFREWLVQYLRSPGTLPIALDLLIGFQSLASRPYHRSLRDVEFAQIALDGALGEIQNDSVLMSQRAALSIVATLSQLLAQTRYTSLTTGSVRSAQDAWADLRRCYLTPVMDHSVDAPMSSVLVAVQLNRVRETGMWRSTLNDWQTTQDFLIRNVLPYLPAIKDIILARLYYRGSDEDIERWRTACTPQVLNELQKINSLLVRFVESPEYALARKDEARRLISWWHRFFFAKPSEVSGSEGGGLLAALSDCPCRIGDAIQEAVRLGAEKAESIGRPIYQPEILGDMSQEIFCNRLLVKKIIEHLFENAIDLKHAAKNTINTPIHIRFAISVDEHEVHTRVQNDGTRPCEPIGRGIGYFDRYIQNYGGSLTGTQVRNQSGWTFEARLVLQRYRPVYPVMKSVR